MRFLYQLLATALICFAVQYFLPWWTMALAAGGVAYVIGNKGFVSFLAGLIGVGLLWLGTALIIDTATHSLLTQKVNKLLPMNAIVLTTLIGALVGGFSALTGSLLKSKK